MTVQLSTNTGVLWFNNVDPTVSETGMDFCYFWFNTSSKDLFILKDATFGAEVWAKFVFLNQLATVAISGSYNDLINKPASPSTSSVSRSLNSVFQISSTRNSSVTYSVNVSCTSTLTSGQSGTVFLEYADDAAFTTNVIEVCRFLNSNTGTLVIGLSLVQNITGILNGFIPIAKYCRIRTANTLSTPTFAFQSGQEVLM